MSRDEFLAKLDELLELTPGTLQGPEKLEELDNWNSLAVLGFIGLADEHFGVTLAPRLLAGCSTVEDLVKLAGAGD